MGGYTDEDLELAIDWTGEVGALVSRMAAVGFLDGPEGSRAIHDWAEHNPWAAGADARAEGAKWAALCKRYGHQGASLRMPDYAARMRTGRDAHAGRTEPHSEPHAPLPSPLPSPLPKNEPTGSSAPADADAPPTKFDPIPYQAIVDAYNATLTKLPKVRELTAKRRTLIRTAWQASPQRRSLAFWQAYLAECQDNAFLNGTGPYREPHENWLPNFDYLLKAKVVTQTYERAMDRLEREGVVA
ncbi:MAG: hypothetical protein ACREPE_04685 [Lysobacter sp.]